jgi:serine/threonine protein kinase
MQIEQEVYFSQDTLVSEAAKDFMMCCLNKDPNDRASIRQLLDHEFLARMEKFRWTII